MSKENYIPNAKEVKNAENSMSDVERRSSEKREELLRAWRDSGKQGYLEYKKDGKQDIIEGHINGHKIVLERGSGDLCSAEVDGIKFSNYGDSSDRRASALWNKYRPLAIDSTNKYGLPKKEAAELVIKDLL